MTTAQKWIALDICLNLFISYNRYLDILYSLGWKALREQENHSLAMLAISLQNEARRVAINTLKDEIRFIHTFWSRVQEDIQPIAFMYIYWDPEQPEGVPSQESSTNRLQNAVLTDYSQNKEMSRAQKRSILHARVEYAHKENTQALRDWCEQLFQIMCRYFDAY